MTIPSFSIGNLSIPLPIIQGGMGIGISLSGLAGAVSRAGGVGVIAAAGIGMDEPDFKTNFPEANSRAMRKQIRAVRDAGKGVLGANIMVVLSNYESMVRAVVEEGVDIIFSGAGLPMSLPEIAGKSADGPKLVPIVSSARAARIICKKWLHRYDRLPDAVVVEGPKAGGHLGFKREDIFAPAFRLEALVPEVVKELALVTATAGAPPIPVIAAGGVYTGKDIHSFMQLGAAAVQLGTRFVATHECDASMNFKRAFLEAKESDITLINSPVGMPGRAIRSQFVDDVENGQRKPFSCPYHCLQTCKQKSSHYCIALALINAQRGKMRQGLVFSGQNAWRVDKILSVQELLDELVAGYEEQARLVAAQTLEAAKKSVVAESGPDSPKQATVVTE